MTGLEKTQKLIRAIDKLARMRVRLKPLVKEEKELCIEVVQVGAPKGKKKSAAYLTHKNNCTVSKQIRETVRVKELAAALGIPASTIKRFTNETPFFRVEIKPI